MNRLNLSQESINIAKQELQQIQGLLNLKLSAWAT
jgi:hypothetical protein